jgi:hypothetical protein
MVINSFGYLLTDDGLVHHPVGTTFLTLSAEERPAAKVPVSCVSSSHSFVK